VLEPLERSDQPRPQHFDALGDSVNADRFDVTQADRDSRDAEVVDRAILDRAWPDSGTTMSPWTFRRDDGAEIGS
jgi:hypothetical protein